MTSRSKHLRPVRRQDPRLTAEHLDAHFPDINDDSMRTTLTLDPVEDDHVGHREDGDDDHRREHIRDHVAADDAEIASTTRRPMPGPSAPCVRQGRMLQA